MDKDMNETDKDAVKDKKDKDPNGTPETHPSWGMIEITRFTGGGHKFFDSPIRHHGGITLKIQRAQRTRTLARHWLHSRQELIEVSMTNEQFAQMLTTQGHVPGTACTIDRFNGEQMPAAEQDDHRAPYDADLKESVSKVGEKMKPVSDLVAALVKKGSATKKDLAELAGAVQQMEQQVHSNMPYFIRAFSEGMSRVEVAAKIEIKSFLDDALRGVGLSEITARLEGGVRHLLGKDDPVEDEKE